MFRCDSCGKTEAGSHYGLGWHKPIHWYERSDEDGAQLACSRSCVDRGASASGKSGVVAPW